MLNHRTNVLFAEEEYQALAALAKKEGVSVGHLIRRATKTLLLAVEQQDEYSLQNTKKTYLQIKDQQRTVTAYQEEEQQQPLAQLFSQEDYHYLARLARKKQQNLAQLLIETLSETYELPSARTKYEKKQAFENILNKRKELKQRGVRITQDEIHQWKHEGHKY